MDYPVGSLIKRVTLETELRDRIAELLLPVICGLILFALTANWPETTHDGATHTRRIESLTSALRAGVIFPRWFPDLLFGYGAPVFNYYPSAFYYPPALLQMAGLGLLLGLRIALSLGYALSAWWMYRLSRLYVSFWPAVASVVCYQFFPYRIHDLFSRGAFPEFSGFIWLPAIALYSLQAATAGKGSSLASPLPKMLAMAGLAWAGLILSHNVSAFMAALLVSGLLFPIAVFGHRTGPNLRHVLVSSVVPLAIGMLLSSWYILPALLELRWVLNGNGLFSGGSQGHFREWSELVDFSFFYVHFDPSHRPRLPVYVIPIVLAALVAIPAIGSRGLRLFVVYTLGLTLVLCWLMTDSSVWLWYSVESLMDLVQFPWRCQIFVALGVALLLAASLEILAVRKGLKAAKAPLLSLLISAYLIANSAVGLYTSTEKEAKTLGHWNDSIENWLMIVNSHPTPVHFFPLASATSIREAAEAERSPWAKGDAPNQYDGTSVTPTHAGLLTQNYIVNTEQEFTLLFHLFHFPPWGIAINGENANVQPETGLSLVSVVIPPGTHTIALEWRATSSAWLGRLMTAAGWMVVFALLTRSLLSRQSHGGGARQKPLWAALPVWPAAVWLVVGAFMVVAASGMTARTWDIEEIGADYGFIRLEGVRSIPPVRAGEVVPIDLTWFVTGHGAPVSAFVHLVDANSALISQYDGPPGGEHTNYRRWIPGLIISSKHNIALPDALPPGTYQLLAGLYFPDSGLEPLMPLGGTSSRLQIGTIEVVH